MADGEGYTVVYSVFVAKGGMGDVEFAAPGTAMDCTLLAAGWIELLGAIDEDGDCNAEEDAAALELDKAPVGSALCEPRPG
jgi:hypothetical protein